MVCKETPLIGERAHFPQPRVFVRCHVEEEPSGRTEGLARRRYRMSPSRTGSARRPRAQSVCASVARRTP